MPEGFNGYQTVVKDRAEEAARSGKSGRASSKQKNDVLVMMAGADRIRETLIAENGKDVRTGSGARVVETAVAK
ncbi:MAG: hypothetical protein MZU95_09965 [Desulfomicrobium escambiense]|nr:hypothetical protein [Desulfomicrobium escambiense]